MRIKDIKDMREIRDLSSNDMVDLLDELKVIAGKRGTELLEQGRVQARRAIGAPDGGAVGTAFLAGIALGAAVGAVATLLMSPMPGTEARRRLTQQVEKVRERVPDLRPDGNGRSLYERPMTTTAANGGSTASPIA